MQQEMESLRVFCTFIIIMIIITIYNKIVQKTFSFLHNNCNSLIVTERLIWLKHLCCVSNSESLMPSEFICLISDGIPQHLKHFL